MRRKSRRLAPDGIALSPDRPLADDQHQLKDEPMTVPAPAGASARNVARERVRIKPTIPVLNFRSYIDTHVLMLATARLMTTEKKRLREAYGTHPHIKANYRLGCTMITVQCPQRDVLYELHDLHTKYDGAISRADLAFEADPDPNMSVDEQMAWIKAHLIMKRRPAGPILEIKNKEPEQNGFYFIPHAHTSNAPRDVCGYGDRPPKLDQTRNRAARLDERMRRKEGHGFETIPEMMQCDPQTMFNRHLKFVRIDMQEFERKLFKDTAKGKTLEEAKRAITHIKRSWTLPEYQFQYAQRVHDRYPRMEMIEDPDLVTLPMTLTWGAKRRSCHSSTYQSVTNEIRNSSSLKHAAQRRRITLTEEDWHG